MFVAAVWVAGDLDVRGKRQNVIARHSKLDDAVSVGSEKLRISRIVHPNV
jgi:hypothetical protein